MDKLWCIKCKKKQEVKDIQKIIMKNKLPAAKGVCSVCGTKLYRIGR